MNILRRSIVFAAIFAGLFAGQPLLAADYSAFAMMVPCSVKTVGLGLTGNVTKFPLLVRIGPSVMRNVTRKTDGGDIRFSKSGSNKANLTPLPYQKERWHISGADSVAEFWVLVDTVYRNNNTQMIYLHCGHSSAQDSSRPADVFSTTNGFRAVWHLAETGAGQRLDATGNNCHLDAYGYTGAESVPGLIGRGDKTGVEGKYLYKNNPSPAQITGSAITVSCWVGNWDTTLSQAHFLTKYNYGAPPSTSYKIWGWGITGIGTIVTAAGEMTGYLNGLVHGAWNHVAMTYDGANLYVYVNGKPSQAYPHTGVIVDCTEPFRFRYQSNGAGLYNAYLNSIDEARLEFVARSPDWVKLCYETQRPNSPVVRLGVASRRDSTAPANPLTMTAAYVSGTRINITVRNIRAVNTAPIPPPYATEIGLWFVQSGNIDTAVSKVFKKWAIGAADSISETVTVPAPTLPAHTTYRFWVCPLWNTGPNGYSGLNGADVTMRPVNRFNMSGKYLGNKAVLPAVDLDPAALDSALVTITNPAVIDTPSVTKVVLSWGLSPAQMIKTDTIPVNAFKGWWGISSPLFVGDTQRVYVRAVQVSANGLASLPAETSFIVGWPKPRYTGILTIDTVGPTYAVVHWDPPSGTADSIRIIHCQTPDTIAVGPIRATEVGTRYAATYASGSALSLRVTGLKMESNYWLGLQIKQNGQWSDITMGGRKLITTKPVDPTSIVPNTTEIDSVWFDPLRNAFMVKWRLELNPALTLDLGITYATSQSAVSSANPDDARKSSVIQTAVTATSGETRVALGDSVKFETLYWVALWLRSSVGPWAPPTPASIDTCRTGKPLWQIVKYFESGIDVVRAFNGQVILRNDGSYPAIVAPISDTAKAFTPPAALLKGFVPVSIGVAFQKSPYDSVVLGLKYGAIPYPLSINDVGLYRDSGGVWLAVHGFTVDQANGIIWHKTKLLTDIMGNPIPYILMADTVRPSIVIAKEDTSDIAQFGANLYDTVTLSDNVRNLSWRLLYARGDEPFVADANRSASGVACGSCPGGEKVVLTIPSRSITDAVGVRAILIISDGPHSDTINLSRRIMRENSDAVTTEEQKWTPLWVTADLDSPKIMDALAEMAEVTGGAWKYDKTQFRLYRWLPVANKPVASNDHWLEYSAAHDSLFALTPGRVLWLKTRTPISVGFGRGVTLSTKAPYVLRLQARQFTDIALPFAMSVKIGDIMAASGRDADSIDIYQWMKDTIAIDGKQTEVRFSELLYSLFGNDPNLQHAEVALQSRPLEAYTILNRSSRDVLLRIPPIPASMSAFRAGATKRMAAGDEWCVKIVARTGEGYPLSTVYCSVRPGTGATQFLPLAPSFAPVTVGVYDRQRGAVWGRVASHLAGGDGCAWELAFCNESDKAETVRFQVEKCASAPADFQALLVGHDAGPTDVSADSYEILMAPRSRQYRQLAVGASAYLQRLTSALAETKLALLGCTPNQFAGGFSVQFSLPALVDVAQVHLSLIDMQGKRVWQMRASEGLTAGVNRISVRPAKEELTAGVYILRLEMRSHSGKSVAVFKTRTASIR